MRTNMRLYATLIIWFAVMAIMIVMFTASDAVRADPNMGVFVALIFGLGAAISTLAVWLSAIFERPQVLDAAQAAGKRKNVERVRDRDRMSKLVDRLSQDELYELEDLLLEREEQREAGRGA